MMRVLDSTELGTLGIRTLFTLVRSTRRLRSAKLVAGKGGSELVAGGRGRRGLHRLEGDGRRAGHAGKRRVLRLRELRPQSNAGCSRNHLRRRG